MYAFECWLKPIDGFLPLSIFTYLSRYTELKKDKCKELVHLNFHVHCIRRNVISVPPMPISSRPQRFASGLLLLGIRLEGFLAACVMPLLLTAVRDQMVVKFPKCFWFLVAIFVLPDSVLRTAHLGIPWGRFRKLLVWAIILVNFVAKSPCCQILLLLNAADFYASVSSLSILYLFLSLPPLFPLSEPPDWPPTLSSPPPLCPSDSDFWQLSSNLLLLRNVVASPVAEELVFRGCIVPLLAPHFSCTTVMLISPLMFGMCES